eukprot:CFRG1350T1
MGSIVVFVTYKKRTKRYKHIAHDVHHHRKVNGNSHGRDEGVNYLLEETINLFCGTVPEEEKEKFYLQILCPRYAVLYDLENSQDLKDGCQLYLMSVSDFSDSTQCTITDAKLSVLLSRTSQFPSQTCTKNRRREIKKNVKSTTALAFELKKDVRELRSFSISEFSKFRTDWMKSKAAVLHAVQTDIDANTPGATLRKTANQQLKTYVRSANRASNNVNNACQFVDALSRDVIQLGINPSRDDLVLVTEAMKSVDTEVSHLREAYRTCENTLRELWKEELSLILEEEIFMKDEANALTIQEETVEDTLKSFETLTKFIFMHDRLPKRKVVIRIPKDFQKEKVFPITLGEIEEYPRDEEGMMHRIAEMEARRAIRIKKYKSEFLTDDAIKSVRKDTEINGDNKTV